MTRGDRSVAGTRGVEDAALVEEQDLPVRSLFAAVVGQAAAIDRLRITARRPVHAYLLVGPPGVGQRDLVRGFAAALLCPNGGCGRCAACRRASAGVHPDLMEVDRSGPSVTVEDARRVVRLAQRRPLEGHRQVVAVSDVHLARLAAPVLLKTLEEPPGPTVFVLLAETVPEELTTVASRCVRIDLHAVASDVLASWLQAQGLEPQQARAIAGAARGSADRARLLADDESFDVRRALWRAVPEHLDGTGATAARLVTELLASADHALAPLRERHDAELHALAERAETAGDRGVPGRKAVEERHRREERRWRTDEVREGLGLLSAAYRDRLAAQVSPASASSGGAAERVRALAGAIHAVEQVCAEMVRNPNEALMLEALLVRLSAVTG